MLQKTLALAALLLISPGASANDGKETKQRTRASWTGYLMDASCAWERKETESDLGQKHTRKCLEMPACDRSGFGLLTDDNQFLAFDKNGNRKVRVLLQQTKQNDRLRVTVIGTRASDELHVQKIELMRR